MSVYVFVIPAKEDDKECKLDLVEKRRTVTVDKLRRLCFLVKRVPTKVDSLAVVVYPSV